MMGKKRSKGVVIGLLLVVVCFSTPIFAETIILKSGEKIDDEVKNLCFTDLDAYKEQIENLKKAIKENPTDPELYFTLAYLIERPRYIVSTYEGNARYLKKALPYYQKAVELWPGYPEANWRLVIVYRDLREHEKEEIEVLEKYLQVNPQDAKFYFALAVAYKGQGQYNKAKENFQKAKELYQSIGDDNHLRKIEEYLSELP